MTKEHLSAEEAAEYIGKSYGTMANWRTNKMHIDFFKEGDSKQGGGKVWYRKKDLDDYLERQKKPKGELNKVEVNHD